MWELGHKRGWALKNWCFQIVVLEKKDSWAFRGLDTESHQSRTRTSHQSILKERNPEYLWKGLMLKLKLQYFGHLTRRADSLEKTLVLGKIKGKRKRGRQMMRWLDSTTDSMDMNLSKIRETVKERGAWYVEVRGDTESERTQWLNNQLQSN